MAADNSNQTTDDLFMVAIVVIGVTILGTATALWLAVQAAALISNGATANVNVRQALGGTLTAVTDGPDVAWPSQDPGGPLATRVAVGVALGAWFGGGICALLRLARRRQARRTGLATRKDVKQMSERHVVDEGRRLRPDGPTTAASSGYWLGREARSKQDLWASVEDSLIILGPARSGKTTRLLTPTILDWDGPAVVTETRPDLFRNTAGARGRNAPVWVWDPDGDTGAPPFRWSPIAGCQDPTTAIIRATSIVKASGGQGVRNADFWADTAIQVMQSYLHAAAVGGATMESVYRWCSRPTDPEPVELLRSSPTAAIWSEALAAQQEGDPETRSNIWSNLRRCIKALDSPPILRACSPGPGEGFDPAELVRNGAGTVYFQGTPERQKAAAPIIAAAIEAITEEGRRQAARQPNGRLGDPVLLALDEVANVAPLDSLPQLLSEGGGSGLVTMAALQTMSQAEDRWGRERTASMIGAATGMLIFGGAKDQHLKATVELLGERQERFATQSSSGFGWIPSSTQESTRYRPVLTVNELRTLPAGQAIVLYKTMPAAVVELPFATVRPRFRVRVMASQTEVQTWATER